MGVTNRHRTYPSLKSWRKAHEFGQDDAAAFLGLSQGHYSRIERKQQAPRPKLAQAISEKTGVPLETVLGIS